MKKRLVYSGRRLNNQNKFFYRYVNIKDANDIITFTSKLQNTFVIGSILESEVSNNGKTYSEHKHIGQVEKDNPNFNLITEWSLKERLANEEANNIREAKKPHIKSIESLIEEIKSSIWHLNSRERNTIARYVFEQLLKN